MLRTDAAGARWWPSLSLPRAATVFIALVWISIAIPGLAIPKGILILGYCLYLVLTTPFSTSSAIWMASVLLSLLLPTVVACFRSVDTSDMLRHFARMLFFFVAVSAGALIMRRDPRIANVETLDKLIWRTAFSSMLLKVAILGGVVLGLFTFQAAQGFLGFESVTEDIGANLQRLQFPSDIAIIFLVPCYTGRRRMVDVLFIVSVSIIVFTSFSRFLFGAFVVVLIMRSLWLRTIDRTFITATLIAFVAASLFAVALSQRFLGSASSDSIRTEQMTKLSGMFVEHPIVGTGMGSSVPGYLRSTRNRYFYEVEWYAMAMQFGLLGLTWLIVNFSVFILSQPIPRRERRYANAVLLLWAVSGFTNAYLTAVGGAFGICILLIRCFSDDRVAGVPALQYAGGLPSR